MYKYSGSLYADWPQMSSPIYVAWVGKNTSKTKKVESLVGTSTGWRKAKITNTVTLSESTVSLGSSITFSDQPILIEKAE
ncbi:hypothetical protein EBZ37_14825 [bacterium]|nr:hypothetical protein [bacterium]